MLIPTPRPHPVHTILKLTLDPLPDLTPSLIPTVGMSLRAGVDLNQLGVTDRYISRSCAGRRVVTVWMTEMMMMMIRSVLVVLLGALTGSAGTSTCVRMFTSL